MSEFSAFIAGLIVGDCTPIPKQSGAKLKSNVPLQDVLFLQCLANIISELEKFVQNSNPSPEEFIRNLIPKTNLSEPYTDKEIETINNNECFVTNYVDEMERLQKENALIDDNGELTNDWNSLSAIRRIWQDVRHTPDKENLDLLIAVDSMGADPVKHKNSVYEYRSSAPLYGIAKDYFTSIPAKIILNICSTYAANTLHKLGYEYDMTRFYYDAIADNNGNITSWRQSRRETAYCNLLSMQPNFCKIDWGDTTRRARMRCYNNRSAQSPIADDERQRRGREIWQIYSKLSDEEIKSMQTKTFTLGQQISLIVTLLPIAVIIISAFIAGFLSVELKIPVWIGVILSSLFIGGLLSYWFTTDLSDGDVQKCKNYLLELQQDYYSGLKTKKSEEYASLLDRLDKK